MMMGVLATACEDEELTPTETPEFGYHVPQGDHDYDERIVNWNERCNVFILYKFNLKELYWQVTDWNESEETEEGASYPYTLGLLGAEADENYVGEQLSFMENNFLNFYPDSTLRRVLPLKLLLCGQLTERTASGTETVLNVYNGYDYIAFNWGNEQIRSLTQEEKETFKFDMNNEFLVRCMNNDKLIVPADFYEGANYTDAITQDNMYSRGFLNRRTKQEDDAEYYVEAIISTPYSELIADPGNPEDNADYYTSYKGILHENKDVNGAIAAKYEALVNAFKANYGIDLQAIGDATVK